MSARSRVALGLGVLSARSRVVLGLGQYLLGLGQL